MGLAVSSGTNSGGSITLGVLESVDKLLDAEQAAGLAQLADLAEVVDQARVFVHPLLVEVRRVARVAVLHDEQRVLADGLDQRAHEPVLARRHAQVVLRTNNVASSTPLIHTNTRKRSLRLFKYSNE